MKRKICLLMALLLMLLSVVSCQNGAQEATEANTTTARNTEAEAVLGDVLTLVRENASDYVITVDYRDSNAIHFAIELSDMIHAATGVHLDMFNGNEKESQAEQEIVVGNVRAYVEDLVNAVEANDFAFSSYGDDLAFYATDGVMYDYMSLVVKETLFTDAGKGYMNLPVGVNFQYSTSEIASVNYVSFCVSRLTPNGDPLHEAVLQALKEKMSGKYISFLGDSISTYDGYTNNVNYNTTLYENPAYYPTHGTLKGVNQTYWMGAVNDTGMTLLVNNSWSGDKVTSKGVSRSLQLAANAGENKGKDPEIIAVMLGVNDFNQGVALDALEKLYNTMVKGMRQRYPNADIFLFTLPANTRVSDVQKFEECNKMIESIAKANGCTTVDAYHCGITFENVGQYTSDGLHPNVAGMARIKNCLLATMARKYLA